MSRKNKSTKQTKAKNVSDYASDSHTADHNSSNEHRACIVLINLINAINKLNKSNNHAHALNTKRTSKHAEATGRRHKGGIASNGQHAP